MSLIQLVLLLGIIWRTWSESHRFILIEQSKNWDESQKYCRKAYEDLATVQGPEDRVKLQQAADAAGFTSFAWIGFYNGVLKWRWSFHNEDMGFSSWASWEPNMPRTQEACVFMNERQEWSDTSCFEQKQVLCQTDKGPVADKIVLVSSVVGTWREAQLYCRTNYQDLATIKDNNTNVYIANLLYTNNIWEAWIGLSKNLWLWSDQTNVSWPLVTWQSGQPDNIDGNEECGCAGTQGQIADDKCATKRFFYCEIPDKPTVRRMQLVRVAVKTDGSLQESAMMEVIEKQMNLMLSEQKMNTDSNITWRIQSDGKILRQDTNDTHGTTAAVCEHINPVES
ncbi:macrophage mannose receptor 1-like isoform X1 [Danio rerio]|uniref:Macrophage mannose receptor 1-like isoform X1 n=1 Tax=Danio rerio TaxID=7955 RepID=A0AC58G2F0_DANRE